MLKRCRECKKELKHESFHVKGYTKAGAIKRDTICKCCKSLVHSRLVSLYGDSGAKQCSQCNQILSWDKFSYRIQSGQRYLRSKCKDCTLTAWTEWAALHPEHKNAKRVSDQKCHQNYKKFHRRGITRDQYLIMLEQQCGCCAICKKPPKDGNDLAIDHNHKTNAVRGLLCKECNRGLGLFGDNIKTVQNALQYLQQRGSYG